MFITIRTCCLFPCRKKYHNDSRCIIVLLFHNCVGMDAVFGLVWFGFVFVRIISVGVIFFFWYLFSFDFQNKSLLIIYIRCGRFKSEMCFLCSVFTLACRMIMKFSGTRLYRHFNKSCTIGIIRLILDCPLLRQRGT